MRLRHGGGSLANFLTTDQRVQGSRQRKIGQNSESIVLQSHQRTVDKLASVDYCKGPVYVVINSKYLSFGRKNKVNTFQYSWIKFGLKLEILDETGDFGRTKNDILDNIISCVPS